LAYFALKIVILKVPSMHGSRAKMMHWVAPRPCPRIKFYY